MPRTLVYTTDVAPLMDRYWRGELTARQYLLALIRMANPDRK